MSETEKVYSVGQVARLLGMDHEAGRKRVRRLIASGKLRAEDHGTGERARWFVTQREVRSYISTRRDHPQKPQSYLN